MNFYKIIMSRQMCTKMYICVIAAKMLQAELCQACFCCAATSEDDFNYFENKWDPRALFLIDI